MKIVLSVLVCIKWAIVMVTAQDFPQIDSPSSCKHIYSFKGQKKGIFQSPNFPDNYPERTKCTYFFRAGDNGRVKIDFDFFDLESSDDDCKYDFLEFSNFNKAGVKESKSTRYCGKSKPPVFVSTQSKLEIIFFSDVTTNARGFFGHFELLESNWNPFPLPTIGCGAGYLTGHGGVIESPNYPSPYPAQADCTWIVNVKETERVLLHFESLDIRLSVKCQEASLTIFEGFSTADSMPASYYCGQISQEPQSKTEYLSKMNRIVVRFQSRIKNTSEHIGFKAIWTAVTFADTGKCGDRFECSQEVSAVCGLTREKELCNNKHYCIHESLTCNDVYNCGAKDDSDENKCLYYILKYIGYIGGPLIAVIIIIVIAVCCYRRHCGNKVKYSVPKEQSMSQSGIHSAMSTNSSNLHVRSLDHSPRSSCVMYTTAFTDASPTDHANCKLGERSGEAEYSNNSNSLPLPNNTSSFIPEVLDDDNVKLYRGHQKRPSYHMMRELCYEDGKIITANI